PLFASAPTRFPYTTLFRSLSVADGAVRRHAGLLGEGPTSRATGDRHMHHKILRGTGIQRSDVIPRDGRLGHGVSLRVLTEDAEQDRKSTRLNSSHQIISYA